MDNLLYSLENRLYLNSLVEIKNVALITAISTNDSTNESSTNPNTNFTNEFDTKIKYLLIDNQYAKVHLWNPQNPYANKN